MSVLPEIHVMASRGEDHLYQKHCNGGAPTQTLLMEMLHAKRKWRKNHADHQEQYEIVQTFDDDHVLLASAAG